MNRLRCEGEEREKLVRRKKGQSPDQKKATELTILFTCKKCAVVGRSGSEKSDVGKKKNEGFFEAGKGVGPPQPKERHAPSRRPGKRTQKGGKARPGGVRKQPIIFFSGKKEGKNTETKGKKTLRI